jgi:phosphatidylserine decarboxylase
MAKEGYPFIFVPLFLSIAFAAFGFWVVAIAFFLLAVFMAYFFRDPERVIPVGTGIIVAPADGRITRIEENAEGKFVSIFLSPFDVHINRAPIGGRITKIEYTHGKKVPATREEASLINERNSLTIEDGPIRIRCTQIAGILARRIVCRKKQGDAIERGERFGLIKFGSRTDLQMPANVEVLVRVDQHVKGGESIIARIVS